MSKRLFSGLNHWHRSPCAPCQQAGFSLVELMMTIAMIAMLSTMAATAYGYMMERVKTSLASSQEAEISHFIVTIRLGNSDSPPVLGQMTGSFCTICVFDYSGAVKLNAQVAAFPANDANWVKLGFTTDRAPLDPWGNPFTFDENELEQNINFGAVVPDCRYDAVISAGPDGILNTADDVVTCVPHAICPNDLTLPAPGNAIGDPCLGTGSNVSLH